MTVGTELCRATFTWTGVETSLSCGFPADKAADVVAFFRTAAGVQSTLAQGVNYSVTLASGTKLVTVTPITMPAAAGTIVVTRDTPALVTEVLVDGQDFSNEVIQQLHDRAAMRDAELLLALARAIRLAETAELGSGAFDLQNTGINNLAPGTTPNSAATVAQIQGLLAASGNVPAPVGGQVGQALVATAPAVFAFSQLGLAGLADAIFAVGATGLAKFADGFWTTAALAKFQDGFLSTAKLADDAATPVKTALGALAPLNLGTLAAAASNALTLTAQGAGGTALSATNRAVLPFRSSTATSGDVVVRNRASADAIVIPAGATLGVPAINTPFSLWLVDVDDNGTLRRGVINCLSGLSVFPLNAGRLLTSTLISDAADAAHVLYTAGAAFATPRAILPVARLEWSSGLATLGNWTAPTRIDPYVSGMKLPGDIVQSLSTRFTPYSSIATTIPVDGTIPQNTEGTRLANLAFTASSAANLARVRGEAILGTNLATTWASATLCRSDQPNCLNANGSYIETSGVAVPVSVAAVTLCGTTNAITYDYRAGPSTGAYSVFYNGVSTAQIYGTGTGNTLDIEEIMT